MKLAFLLLVLVNLALFAWQQGVFGRFAESGREPERIARQIEAERFRVLSEAEVKTLRERASATPKAAAPPGPLDLSVAQACVEFGEFSTAELGRAETALLKLGLGARQAARTTEVPGGFLVYLPPLKTRVEADRRLDELRKQGVRDASVITEGPARFGIGFGSFRDTDAARAQLAALEKSGVKGARMADKPGTITTTRFQLREIDVATAAQLAAIQKEFPAQTMRACPPG